MSYQFSDILTFTELIRNIALIFASGIGSWVAFSRLSTWKKEDIWKRNTELSRKILRKLFSLHSHILMVPRNSKKDVEWTKGLEKLLIDFEVTALEASCIWEDDFSTVAESYDNGVKAALKEMIDKQDIRQMKIAYELKCPEVFTQLTKNLKTKIGREKVGRKS